MLAVIDTTSQAVEELVASASLELAMRHDLDEIEEALVVGGADPAQAAKAIALVPSAFAAARYEPDGIEFPGEFLVGPEEALRSVPYDAEPIYQEAKRLADRWLQEGRPSLVARVLEWSAEASGIEEARSKGLTPSRMSQVHYAGSPWE